MSGSVLTRPSGRAAASSSRSSATGIPSSPNDAEAKLARCSAETVIEGGNGCTARLLGGKEHAAIRQLEAGSGAQGGQPDWGILTQPDDAHGKLSQRGRGLTKAADAGPAFQRLGQGQRARPQRLVGDGTEQGAGILVESIGLVEVRDQYTGIQHDHSGQSSRSSAR